MTNPVRMYARKSFKVKSDIGESDGNGSDTS